MNTLPYKDKERERKRQREFYHKHIIEQHKRAKNYYRKNKTKAYLAHQKWKRLRRRKLLDLLGNKCSNPSCLVPNGCSDWRALQIDHVNGGGTKERKRFRCYDSYETYIHKQIKAGSKDYQLLCANCNMIKKYANREFFKPVD